MKTKPTEGNSLPSPVLREVSQPESGAFWLQALYERNHTRTGMLRLLKL
jgi:hypothetical protein